MNEQITIENAKTAIREKRFLDALAMARKMGNVAAGLKLADIVFEAEALYLQKTGGHIHETALQHAMRHQIGSSSARARLEKMVASGKASRECVNQNGTRVVIYSYTPEEL